ncbi:MAG TPA: LytTR family DNA-binding domain-containing protein [Bacteroidia bacterium]|jgi:two-component system LytT family response regulator|nr:LytTR family DNA-binding domain-containing protein [Bacteroidia bacterium]
MIRAILVDDEPKSREVLKTLLGRFCPQVEVLGMAANVEEGKQLIKTIDPQIIFLDVEMPGGNGFKLLDDLEQRSSEVIFVTSYGHYAIPALRYSAIDYLLKPVEVDELVNAVNRAEEKINSGNSGRETYKLLNANLQQPPSLQKLAIHGVNEIKFAPLKDIIRMQGDNNYTFIFTSNGEKFHSSRTLKDYEDMLASQRNFIRIHKAHLVNAEHVYSFIKTEGGYVVMSDGSRVEVSRRKKQELMERLGIH